MLSGLGGMGGGITVPAGIYGDQFEPISFLCIANVHKIFWNTCQSGTCLLHIQPASVSLASISFCHATKRVPNNVVC